MSYEDFKNRILESEKFNPFVTLDFEGKKVRYATPNSIALWRVNTITTKEPDTIAWMNSFDSSDVMVDIGANVGMYTVYAAAVRGCRVFAFEPESQNYALLNRNLMINDLSNLVTGYCVALNDKEEFNVLNLSEFAQGGSNHSFKEDVDFKLEAMKTVYKQGCFATTLDALIARGVCPVPQHIKIDVDGLEHKVITGMSETLKNEGVKSVLVEINTNLAEHRDIIETLNTCGLMHSEAEAAASIGRQDKTKFDGVGNYIFYRGGAPK